jgi:hypothetical protein
MTCVELQESLAERDDAGSSEQRDHLRSCPHCAALVTELARIASSAPELREAHEPSPRVWKSIEATLRREGIIRPQSARYSLLPAFGARWGWSRWLVPAAAAFLITVGLYVRQQTQSHDIQSHDIASISEPVSDAAVAGLNDDDLLQEVSQQTPALREQYEDNLRHVNEYIQDAKSTVAANPNDEDARRSLMDAYQEKAMLFDLAMDRSLP